MTTNAKSDNSCQHPGTTLADLLAALVVSDGLSATRRRDLHSAVRRVAALLREEPHRIKFDLPAISMRLGGINPVGEGLSAKRLANIRSDFLAAARASGLKPIARPAKQALSSGWADLLKRVATRRDAIGLSRLARFASANEIDPADVNDAVLERFIAAVREGSLHRKPNVLHRTVASVWNEVASVPSLNLQRVTVPSFRDPARRIDWAVLPPAFREDLENHLAWCAGSDPFDPAARVRQLAPQTVRLRRDQVHAAVTALVESGTAPTAVMSLAALVTPDALKGILRRRLEAQGGRHNVFNRDLGAALVQIAREWVKADDTTLTELRRLVGKMPVQASGLTDKNKRFLRQFDDPAVVQRLFDLPARLWAEVKRETTPNFRTLAKAQVALAVALLTYMPLRGQNLTALTFDVHIFLRDGVRAVSSLELNAGEVKNRTELAFDIPPHVAKMLIEYRDRVAPKILGHRPERLFVNVDGSTKHQKAVADLIARNLRARAGIVVTPHQFRHLSAKFILDATPGSFETVKQLLGHKNLKTTVASYAGIDSRRAARHHQLLIEQLLATQTPPPPKRSVR